MADISRAELSTLIEDAYSHVLLDSAQTTSAVLSAFTTVDMGTKTSHLPVLATLPEASWVSETDAKPTAQVTWADKTLVAEELAVIIPVHENVVDDATVDVISQLSIQGGAAIGRALDAAVIFGTNKPVSWTSDDLLTSATDASQTFTVGADEDDLAGSIFQAAGAVDEAGWDPDRLLVPRGIRYRLANLRSDDNAPIFLPSLSAAGGQDDVAGLTPAYVSGRVWDRDEAEAIVVDSSRVIIGVRQDISVKFLDQATVGSINLAERDMVALRFKARYAYVLGENVNSEGTGVSPVAAVLPGGS